MLKYLKHIIHVVILYTWLTWNLYTFSQLDEIHENDGTITDSNLTSINATDSLATKTKIDSIDLGADLWWAVLERLITFIQYFVILPCPQVVCNLLGLTFFNTFPGDITMNITQNNENESKECNNHKIISEDDGNPPNGVIPTEPPTTRLPHLCFRVVTRGTFPELVQNNVKRNFLTCVDSGLLNFSIEVVTDQDVYLNNNPKDCRIRQIIVPKEYQTTTGALYKARALQYALETDVNKLKPGDYIVHLDEETILSNNVVHGICNFAIDGRYSFGQGLITYSNFEVVNILTTLADSYRVADDMGKVRLQLAALHKPIFGWKGSFVVSKYEAELDVTYDHGLEGSIAEDCYFSMVAMNKKYTFDFIQGEMYEKSPFTIIDFIKQRRRWVQGIWLVVHSCKIPIKTKFFLAMSHYAWLTMPIITVNIALSMIRPIPMPFITQILGKFCFAITSYMYIFGFFKSADLKRRPLPIMILYFFVLTVTITFNAVIENLAVIWGVFSKKNDFYIVKKETNRKAIPDS